MYGRYCEQRDFLYFFFLSFRNLIRCNHGFIFSGVGTVFPSRVSPFISSFPDFFLEGRDSVYLYKIRSETRSNFIELLFGEYDALYICGLIFTHVQ